MGPLDEDRFLAWWTEIEPAVVSLGRRLLGTIEAARDLAQDVAVGALLRFGEIRDANHFRAWVLTRARWLALDRIRAQRRTVYGGEDSWPERPAPSGSENYDAGELLRLVGALPERQKAVMMRSIAGESVADIAAELGITPATVRSLLRHARFRLAQALNL